MQSLADLLDLELPAGRIPTDEKDTATPEQNDAWQWENTRMRWERGDFSRSDTPVNVMFEIK
ncbi:MAG TPA: hypothetical protein DDZ88_22390 [Verrucomicrobiales bacterium]|nr:hypothetical protein [Verrucomicrobiales bacterium]